jgi:hypothetical protein
MTVGRNDPCPCGSGLKYKRCCIDKEAKGSTMADESEKKLCSVCGRVHGPCLVCSSKVLCDDDVEKAILVGYMCALGALVQRKGGIMELVAFTRETLCEKHKPMFNDLGIHSRAHVRGGQA